MLRRQGGHNLAIVGQDRRRWPPACWPAPSSRSPPSTARPAPGSRCSTARGPSRPCRACGPQVAATVGDAVEVVPPRNAGRRRHRAGRRGRPAAAQSPEERFAAIYLVIHDLAQFRDLRQTDDDFSFSFSSGNGKPPAADRRFRDILKEGPAVGVHVLLWCESYNSLTRCIDRLTLREIEFRVATQMSAADSTSLIDSPAAALLGEHRAILYRDDLGTQTKFRPYGPPTAEWLAWAAEQLRREAAELPVYRSIRVSPRSGVLRSWASGATWLPPRSACRVAAEHGRRTSR